MVDWKSKGFADMPIRRISPEDGLLLYRAWGGTSGEWGSGFFSLEKPSSVLDAELRFNIADWGNQIHFVTTFRLKGGFEYFVGPVAHGKFDLSKTGTQIYLKSPFVIQLERVGTFDTLKQDVLVSQRAGNA